MDLKVIASILLISLIGFAKSSDIKMVDESAKCLFGHNFLRELHGAYKLEWDAALAQDCLEYAKWMVKENKMTHSTGAYGENLSLGWGGFPNCIVSVYDWYLEYTKHDFSSDNFIFESGHFTQVVWNATRKVGMAMAHSKELNRWAACARYTPAGNVADQFLENVFPIVNASMLPSSQELRDAAVNITDFPPLVDRPSSGHALGFWGRGKEISVTLVLLRTLPFLVGFFTLIVQKAL